MGAAESCCSGIGDEEDEDGGSRSNVLRRGNRNNDEEEDGTEISDSRRNGKRLENGGNHRDWEAEEESVFKKKKKKKIKKDVSTSKKSDPRKEKELQKTSDVSSTTSSEHRLPHDTVSSSSSSVEASKVSISAPSHIVSKHRAPPRPPGVKISAPVIKATQGVPGGDSSGTSIDKPEQSFTVGSDILDDDDDDDDDDFGKDDDVDVSAFKADFERKIAIDHTLFTKSRKNTTKEDQKKRKKELGYSNVKTGNVDAEMLVYICGDGGVGKTCLATSFAECGYFEEKYVPTIFNSKDVYMPMKLNGKSQNVKIRVVDTAGQDDVYDTIEKLASTAIDSFVNSRCKKKGIVFLLCYAVNSPASFENTRLVDGDDNSWLARIRNAAFKEDDDELKCENMSLLLVGTKNDQKKKISKDAIGKWIADLKSTMDDGGDNAWSSVADTECSALLSYKSVQKVFQKAAKMSLAPLF
eukprot:g12.t1